MVIGHLGPGQSEGARNEPARLRHGPTWWVEQRSSSLLLEKTAEDVSWLNLRTKRKYRQLRSHKIRAAIHRRDDEIAAGRMKRAFASLLGKQRSSFAYDTLTADDGSTITDAIKIHRRLQQHYCEVFGNDPESLIQQLDLDQPCLGSTPT